MQTKTMEGLVGANMSMRIMDTPMRVYREAERKGDTAVMERAMGYAGDVADKAEDYQKKAEKGMKEDAKDARDNAKLEQENVIRKRREEREGQEKRVEESQNGSANTDMAADTATATATDGSVSVEETADTMEMEPVIYTKTGETVKPEPGANFSVSV